MIFGPTIRRRAIILALLVGVPLGVALLRSGFNALASVGDSVIHNVAYGDLPREQLDIYLPARPSHAPVIVFFHGGTWSAGSKEMISFVGKALSDWGYIAVLPNYRLFPSNTFPDFMVDSARAVAWTHDHIDRYGGDPNALFVAGHSAGAYNAVMLALDKQYLTATGGSTDWIRGVIALAGPYDFSPTDPDVNGIFAGTERPKMDPLNFVDGKKPPMLLMTGDADNVVPPRDSQTLGMRLQQAGNPVTFKVYSRLGHIDILTDLAKPHNKLQPDIADFIATVSGH